jgi:hypothetical protein
MSTVKLSVTSKLGVKSWSLQALETCPAAYDTNGEIVKACAGCYARGNTYYYPNVIAVREFNKKAWKMSTFVSDFVDALSNERYFRWFDSGDMYTLELAEKMYNIMVLTPWVSHWLPTRMQKFSKFADIIEKMNALPNVKVRFSADTVDGTYTKGLHGSVIVPTAEQADTNTFVCKAPENEGKCGKCRACYDKNVDLIGYIAHGARMKKVIRLTAI